MFTAYLPDLTSSRLMSVLAVVITAIGVAWKLTAKLQDGFSSQRKKITPKKWVKVGTVRQLMIYPIKSCQGFPVDTATLTGLGLKCLDVNIRDRDFLLVDGNKRQLTMAMCPKMALVQVNVETGNKIVLNAPDMPELKLALPKQEGQNMTTCKIKDDTAIKVLDCGDDVANWFQTFLGKENLRLCYYYLNETQRTWMSWQLECPQYNVSDFGSFQNASAYMVIAMESVDEFNKYLSDDKKCNWTNFRPTILIEGVSEPFAEVNWSYIKVGNGEGNRILNVAAPCYRCPVITVDQKAGVISQDGEPLKTLRSLDKVVNDLVVDEKVRNTLKNKGVLGLRVGLYDNKDQIETREGAKVSVGDSVYAALL